MTYRKAENSARANSFSKIKKRLAVVMTAGLFCVTGVSTGFAGPSDEVGLINQVGPGGYVDPAINPSNPAGSGQTNSLPMNLPLPGIPNQDNSYYNLPINDPIVHPVDKYSYAQMEADMAALARRYPDKVRITSIATTADGRNVYDMVIGSDRASKKILVNGAIHGREYMVVPIIMKQTEQLLAYSGTGTYMGMPLSQLMSGIQIHVIPMANPDGVSISQFGEDGIRSDSIKNLVRACYAMDVNEGKTGLQYFDYLKRWKSNAMGVNLNTNYDVGWADYMLEYMRPSSVNFKGTMPLSERESKALANLATSGKFVTTVSYHCMGNLVYWQSLENAKQTESLELAAIISQLTGYRVDNGVGKTGFKDWTQKLGIRGVTIELGSSQAPVDFGEFPILWEQNKGVPGAVLMYTAMH